MGPIRRQVERRDEPVKTLHSLRERTESKIGTELFFGSIGPNFFVRLVAEANGVLILE
jgi:hypothetical protein